MDGSAVVKSLDEGTSWRRKRRCACGATWNTKETPIKGTLVATNSHARETLVARGGHKRPAAQVVSINSGSDPDQITPVVVDPERARVSDFVEVFPVLGGETWGLERHMHDAWVAAFPALDLAQQYKQAIAWLNANPTNRKTPKGMPRFLHLWLSRNQDRAPRANGAGPKAGMQSPYCAFHRSPGTHRKAPPTGMVSGCPECKHVEAARAERVSEPMPISALR